MTWHDMDNQRKADPEAFGVAVATDESPPSQRRFGGYRFQVTMVYYPSWHPVETWERAKAPPLDVHSKFLDVCHCPGKDGATVMQVLDKQLSSIGLSRFDVVSMTGDGGAENEGMVNGMHALLEAQVPGYVRRRCLGHLAWRCADAVIAGIPDYADIKKICEYFSKGVTWTRLQALASLPVADHGMGLLAERSPEFKRVFFHAPGPIVDTRPESDKNFLQFLGGKERVLSLVAVRDVSDRALAPATQLAVTIMGDVRGRAVRRVAAEVLHRALFLHFWVNDHVRICGGETLENLTDKAKAVLQDVALDEPTMKRLGCEDAWFARTGLARPETWVALAVLMEFEDEDLARGALPHVLGVHGDLVARGTAHLALVVDNIMRSSWIAGGILHKDPVVAQSSAQRLLVHLDSVAPHKRSAFETHLAGDERLMDALADFAHREDAVCVWHGHGAYKHLFRFLAVRFLLAPDEVLDCERAHARWNWWCLGKRSLKLPALNARLRLTAHLEQHLSQFPPHAILKEFLERAADAQRVARAEVDAMEDIAPGYREAYITLERFNLRAADIALVRDGHGAPGDAAPMRTDLEGTASVYLRNTFLAKHFYRVPTLGPGDVWFYILENKVLAGRVPRDRDDAQTRPLVVCFFKKVAGDVGDVVVQRMDDSFPGMTTLVLTPAELALRLGYALETDAGRTPQEVEALVEKAWLTMPRLCYRHEHVLEGGDLHTYNAFAPMHAEDVFWESEAPGVHTKYAIARRLEREHGWDPKRLWGCSLKQLQQALENNIPPWDDTAPVEPVPAEGRGRGRGRGRAPGRGRGGAAGVVAGGAGRGRGRAAAGAAVAAVGAGPAAGRGRAHARGKGKG